MKTILTYLVHALVAMTSSEAAPSLKRRDSGSMLNPSYATVKFGQSRSNIESYSLATMSRVASAEYHPFGYLRNGLTALAEWDLLHGTKRFKDQVHMGNAQYANNPGPCQGHWKVPLVNDFNDFTSWAGLGVLSAYEAYGDPRDLQLAQGAFEFVLEHGYITEADTSSGYLTDTKPATTRLEATCKGESMVGGVYWQNGCPSDLGATRDNKVDAVSTGAFAFLGASLCRLTRNETYCDKAYSSLQWIDRVLRQKNVLIASHIYANTCHHEDNFSTYNAGLYIAAYASLANHTNNATALSLAENTAIAAMSTKYWNDEQGVITQGVGHNVTQPSWFISFGPILVRALYLSHPIFGPELQQAVIDYINIQYWAITQLDSNNVTHPVLYGRNWTGPAFEVATNQTMTAALDVLNAISINPDSSFPNTSTTSEPVASLAHPRVAVFGTTLWMTAVLGLYHICIS